MVVNFYTNITEYLVKINFQNKWNHFKQYWKIRPVSVRAPLASTTIYKIQKNITGNEWRLTVDYHQLSLITYQNYIYGLLIMRGYNLWWLIITDCHLEAVTQVCFVKKVFLEISPNSLENTSARVSFLIKL